MVRNSSNHFIQYEKFSQGKTGKQWSWNFGWDGNGFSFSKAPKAYHVFHPRLLSKIHANNEKLSEKDKYFVSYNFLIQKSTSNCSVGYSVIWELGIAEKAWQGPNIAREIIISLN